MVANILNSHYIIDSRYWEKKAILVTQNYHFFGSKDKNRIESLNFYSDNCKAR